MRFQGVLAATAATTALIVPSSALAAEPLGTSNGVTVVPSAKGAKVTFQGSASKRFALIKGRKTLVRCTSLPPDGKLSQTSVIAGKTVTAPKTRKAFTARFKLSRAADLCAVARVASTRTVRKGKKVKRVRVTARSIAIVPITRRGSVYLEEQSRAFEMLSTLSSAGRVADTRTPSAYPTSAQFARGKVVALASPFATPPAGRIGFYSNGFRHVTVAAVSSAGRRLFIDVNAGVISSNVLNYLDERR